jgi:hypothetical protein
MRTLAITLSVILTTLAAIILADLYSSATIGAVVYVALMAVVFAVFEFVWPKARQVAPAVEEEKDDA